MKPRNNSTHDREKLFCPDHFRALPQYGQQTSKKAKLHLPVKERLAGTIFGKLNALIITAAIRPLAVPRPN